MIDLTTVSSIAFRAIKANKMRSILTSLGIIIGVGPVIRDAFNRPRGADFDSERDENHGV